MRQDGPITGEHIAERLNVTRAALRSDLAILVMGGILDARPKVGYYFTGKNTLGMLMEEISGILVRDLQSVPVAVNHDKSAYEAVVTMFLEDVGTVFVLDEAGLLVGVVSRKDLLKAAINNARTADKFKAGACHAFGLYYLDRRIARWCVVPDRRNGRYAEISVIYHAAILVCRFYVGRGRTACDKHLRAYTLHIAYNACKRRTFRQKVGSFKGITKGIRIVTYISCIQTHGNSRIRHYEYNE